MICPACSHGNPPASVFCTSCGIELPGTCPACHTVVDSDQNFCGTCGFDLRADRLHASGENSPASRTPAHLARRILADRHSVVGERKRVTVMFADVVGSTAATEGADPEQAAEFLNTALGAMMDAVHRYEGTVNELLGDGIVALFGAPLAHEDHAVRACLAALEIDDAVGAATEGAARSRVGLNSGEVFVQAIGTDLSLEYQALGPTVHLAARMEQMAAPGSVRVTAATHSLAEGFIDARSLGRVAVKGVSEPLELFELTGVSSRSGWDARASRGLTRFVARDREVATLEDLLTRVRAGDGQVVAVVGDPGMGKSRILHEFLEAREAEDVTVLRGGASPYDVDTTYFALKGVVRSALSRTGPGPTSYAAVETAITDLEPQLASTTPGLATMLDLAVPSGDWSDLTPESRRRLIRDAIKRLNLTLADDRPLIVAIEDLHWVDGESQAAIDDLVDVAGGSRILVLVTHRPEYTHQWGVKSYFTRLTLPSLTGADANVLVDALVGSDPSLADLRPRLLARGEGTPLFLEECVRSVAETGRLTGTLGDYRMSGSISDLDIPDSVQAVLAARIDRLTPDEKAVMQAASVIGQVPDLSLLSEIVDGIDLDAALGELQRRELLYRGGSEISPDYRFKHSLTRDVAYESLPLSQRRHLHGRIVEVMQQTDSATGDRVERLAYHALRGELWAEAADFAEAAGEKGIERSAYAEASRFLRSAVDALSNLPDGADTTRRAIDIRMRQRVAETGSLGGFSRVKAILLEASELAAGIGDRERMANVDIHLGYAANMQGDAVEAEAVGRRALETASRLGDRYLTAEAHLVLGQTYSYAGRPRGAVEAIEPELDYLGQELRHDRRGQTMIRSVVAHGHVAMASSLMGRPEEAEVRAVQAVEIAEEAARPFDLLYAYFAQGMCLDMIGRVAESIDSHQRAADIGDEHDLRFIRTFAQPWRGHALLRAARDEEATELLDDVRGLAGRIGLPYVESLAGVFAAEAHRRMGDHDRADALASEALAFARDRRLPIIEFPALRTLALLTSEPAERSALKRQIESIAAEHGYGPWLDQARADLEA